MIQGSTEKVCNEARQGRNNANERCSRRGGLLWAAGTPSYWGSSERVCRIFFRSNSSLDESSLEQKDGAQGCSPQATLKKKNLLHHKIKVSGIIFKGGHSTKTFKRIDEEIISRDRKQECRLFIREQTAGNDNIHTLGRLS